jgi:hypothetical protein
MMKRLDPLILLPVLGQDEILKKKYLKQLLGGKIGSGYIQICTYFNDGVLISCDSCGLTTCEECEDKCNKKYKELGGEIYCKCEEET